MSVTIYHNPRCSKSRQTLEIIEASGVDHSIVKYLDTAPAATTIRELARKLDMPLEALLRRGEQTFKEADDLPDLADDEALADWISRHPIVLERPIVVNNENGNAVIGRPPEKVKELLD